MNLASKKGKYYTRSDMMEKPLELKCRFIPHLGGLNMISSNRSSIFAAWTKYRFKKTDFHF